MEPNSAEFWRAVTERRTERVGQAAFNLLAECAPDLAEQIRGTDCDPFYNDKILPIFAARMELLTGKYRNFEAWAASLRAVKEAMDR